MKKIVIIGAGGHGHVAADILQRANEVEPQYEILGFLDDKRELQDTGLAGLPVRGEIADAKSIAHDGVIVAIGDNRTRMKLFHKLLDQGAQFVSAIHPSAVIAPDVTIGLGSTICAGVVVSPGSVIGRNVILNTGCTVDHHSYIEDHAHIAPGVHTGGDVRIGKGTLVGIGASVAPGCEVGEWSIVAPGAVVSLSLPAGVMAGGLPAKVMRLLNPKRQASIAAGLGNNGLRL